MFTNPITDDGFGSQYQNLILKPSTKMMQKVCVR